MDFGELESGSLRIQWTRRVRGQINALKRQADHDMRQRIVRPRLEATLHDNRASEEDETSQGCRGDDVVRNILRTLDSFRTDDGTPLIRSREQKLFHYWWIQANFPQIYKAEWHAHSERVLKNAPTLFGFPEALTRVYREVLCLTPRRYGKTWAVAMFIAAVLYNVPGFKFATFSTGKRASGWVMRDVINFFKQLPNASERIIKLNQEQLIVSEFVLENRNIARANTGMVSEFNSFPGSVDGKQRHHSQWPSWRRDTAKKHKKAQRTTPVQS